VTFSGGGGSGAAAYATVGSGTTVRSLAPAIDFFSSAGRGARINTTFYSGSALSDWLTTIPSNFGGPTLMADNGAGGNINLRLSSSGTSNVEIFTNSTGSRAASFSHTASAVNYVQVTGAATGNLPTISAQGSDAAVSLAYSAKGLASHRFQSNGGEILRVAHFGLTAPVNRIELFGGTSGFASLVQSGGTDTNVNLEFGTKAAGLFSFKTNTPSNGTGAEQLRVAHTASAVNYVQVTGAATGGTPTISAQGSDANVRLSFSDKGSGGIQFNAGGSRQFYIGPITNSVNFIQAAGGTSGNPPKFESLGTDTNIDLTLTPKGTGNVRFGTYTASMALTVQGYIEIKDSGGTVRKLAVIA
jgi:hypothetical protein